MERLLISINWVVGTIALLLGLIWPFFNMRMNLPAMQAEAEGTIQLLANAEQQLETLQRSFVLFSESMLPSELTNNVKLPPLKERRYEYEAFINKKGFLILRAYTRPPEVLKGRINPAIYELAMDKNGIVTKEWRGFSSQRNLF